MPRGVVRIVAVALMLVLPVSLVGCAETHEQGGSLPGGELQILSHSMTTHRFTESMPESTAVVKGRAQNVSSFTINVATIAVDFYDKDGNLIDTASASRQGLGPGEVWDFNVKFIGPDSWKSVDYDIAASTN